MSTELICDSRIESVTVLARGAVVTRRATLPESLPEEACDLVLEGVTALADPGTLRASLEGGREILGVHAKLVVPERPSVDLSLAGKLAALRRQREDLVTARNHAGWRRDVLASVHPDPELARRALAIDPAARVADALAIVELVTEEMASLDAKIAALGIAIEASEREMEALQVAAAQSSAGEANRAAPPRLSVVVLLGPAKGGAASSLLVEYAILGARWWPVYKARFSEGATRAALSLDAVVAQASGEDWSGVKLSLSTGDLLRDARLPELASLRLGRAQRPRARGYRAPPEGLDAMFEGFDRFAVSVTTTVSTTTTVAIAGPAGSAGWDAPASLATADAGFQGHAALEDDIEEPTAVAMPAELPARAKRMSKARHAAPEQAKAPVPRAPPAPLGGGGAPPAGFAAPQGRAGAPPPMQQEMTRTRAPYAKSEVATGDFRAAIAGDLLEVEGGAAEPEPMPIEPADAWLDFDMLRLDGEPRSARRGRLARERSPSAARIEGAAQSIERLEPPAGAIDPRASRGLFDAVYVAAGTADVPASGRPHRVAVATAQAAATPRFVTVPREAQEVYRRADVANPFGVALLTGPVEVFIDGALVAMTRLSYTDRGGSITIGLGVEERLKVARNARVEEGTAGLLGGSTTVDHSVTTELSSSLGRAVKVEIVDRVPVSDDKDVEIKVLSSQPPSEAYTQADLGQPIRKGLRWEVEVPAGGKAQASWRYRVTLPSKMEVVGGNRRE